MFWGIVIPSIILIISIVLTFYLYRRFSKK
jgi:hypothetical protein